MEAQDLISAGMVALALIIGLMAADYFAVAVGATVLFVLGVGAHLLAMGRVHDWAWLLLNPEAFRVLAAVLMWATLGWGLAWLWRRRHKT